MSNPFAATAGESTFPGALGLGVTAAPFDGPRDPLSNTIKEEEEDVQSPTTPSFRPTFGNSSSSSARRSASPSNSPFLPSTGHLSPHSAQGAFPSNYNMNRRTSVSAESMVPTAASEEWTPPVHVKTPEQLARLKTAVSGNFLFAHLDDEQSSQVLGALVEKPIPGKDIRIICQGDQGDYFYVVEKGQFDVYVNSAGKMMPGSNGMGNKVSSIGPGGSFGELALMYNAPRAATIVSTSTQNVLWALDRVTFRRILMESTFQKRRMYEAFLEEVPVLKSLVAYERSKIADALETATYKAGDTIIQEGDIGDRFFFMESGIAEVHISRAQGPIRELTKGDYFGELALLNDAPRAASIIAKDDVKVAFLDKEGFQRLLGPAVEIMRRNDPTLTADDDPLSNVPRPPGVGGADGSVDVVEEAAGRGRTVEV